MRLAPERDQHAPKLTRQAHDFVAVDLLALKLLCLQILCLENEESGVSDQGFVEAAGRFKLRFVPSD